MEKDQYYGHEIKQTHKKQETSQVPDLLITTHPDMGPGEIKSANRRP